MPTIKNLFYCFKLWCFLLFLKFVCLFAGNVVNLYSNHKSQGDVKMFKRILAITVLVAGINCFAGSAVRVDVNGLKDKIAIKPGKASKGFKIVNCGWMKDRAKYAIMAYSAMNISKEWKEYSFSFTPDKDGIVQIHFRGAYHKPKGAKKNIAVWVAYDNITVTGTEAKNCDFEFVNQKNLFNGWSGDGANMVTGSKNAKSGKNYIVVWHNNPVYQSLKVTKGQEVTITLHAKASEGPAKEKSDTENI